MSDFKYNEEDEPGFMEKHGLLVGMAIVLLLLAVGGVAAYFLTGKIKPPKKPEEIMVKLLPPPPMPPPPPPPPPPKMPPPQQPKMVEQPKVQKDEPKPMAKSDHPPGPSGPKASGPPSDDGIGGTGGDGGGGGGGGGGSRWGWYAGEVQSAITDAMRRNDKTRSATMHIKVRIWADNTGRITRAKLAGSSGDPAVDAALEQSVLDGLTLPEAPPADMPMPIVLRISENRP